MKEADVIARSQGFEEMNLTVGLENDKAIAFYEGIGWQRVSEEGGWRGRMTKSLVDSRGPA
jgi:ribosomal protein S18 acetylase RimI-like enzyme